MGEAIALGRPTRTGVPSPVLGMALFLFTEVMLFAGLVSAYLVLRGRAPLWPPPDQPRLPVQETLLNTAVLLASGWTVWRAHGEGARRWLAITAGLGLGFLVLQGREWIDLLAHGLTTSAGVYGGTFYAIVGLHGLHVLCAVAAVAVGAWALGRARLTAGGLSALRMYWLFVVAVWLPLYALVYLW